jgi:hypothetical protein
MAASPNLIRVNPVDAYGNSITVTVGITDSAGNTPTAYNNNAQGSTVTIGEISASTDYWLAYDDTFTVSVLHRGEQIANQGSTTKSAFVGTGAALVLHPTPANAASVLSSNLFVNEGTAANPYLTPVSIGTGPIWGVESDWRDGVGVAIAGSTMSVTLAGSGIRVFGDGHADDDSGAVAQTAGEGGTVMRLTTTNEAAHMIALGMAAGVMQPDQHELMVVDVEFTNITAITDRSMYVGFIGTAADALVQPVTLATTVATLVQDDLAGVVFDTAATDVDRWYGVSNALNAAATQDLALNGNTGVNVPAAATYQRVRVEIDSAGAMEVFINKASVYTKAAAVSVSEELSPVFYLCSNAADIKTCDVRRFSAWAYRA